MPAEATRAQRLFHHEIVLFGLVQNRLLLRIGDMIDVLAFTPLAAGSSLMETAAALAEQELGISCPTRHIADLLPCQTTFGGVGHVFAATPSPALANALESSTLALVLPQDLPNLAKRKLLAAVPLLLWCGNEAFPLSAPDTVR